MAMPVGMKRAASQAAGWAVAGCCAIFSVAYFAEIKDTARLLLGLPQPDRWQQTASRRTDAPAGSVRGAPSGRTVELRVGAYGHYRTEAEINGRPISVLVDTGASHVALTFEDASRAGVFVRDSDFTQRVQTANGVARVAPVILDRVGIGDITVRDVPATVSQRGMLSTTLLGMSFLNRLERVDMRGGKLLLQE